MLFLLRVVDDLDIDRRGRATTHCRGTGWLANRCDAMNQPVDEHDMIIDDAGRYNNSIDHDAGVLLASRTRFYEIALPCCMHDAPAPSRSQLLLQHK